MTASAPGVLSPRLSPKGRKLTLYLRGRVWWVKGWDAARGKRFYLSLRETRVTVARAMHADLEARWSAGEQVFPAARRLGPPEPLEVAVRKYLHSRRGKVGLATLKDDASRLRVFRRRCGETAPAKVAAFLDWVRARRKPRTYNHYVLTLRDFFKWLGRPELTAGHELLKPGREAVVHLTLDQRAAVLAAARGDYYETGVLLALGSGLRRGELERLDWQDLDFTAKQVLVRRAKGGRPRSVPVPAWARERLAEIGGPVRMPTRGGASVIFLKRLRKASGVKIAGWQIFRHTFGSLLAQAGVSLFKIGHWLGHRDPRTTANHYASLSPLYDPDIELT